MGKYENFGKELVHCDVPDDGGACERYTSVAQCRDNETSHFLAVCANDYYDYMDEADTTNSTIFRPEQINREHFLNTLKAIREHCEVLNLFKKLLVRGKSPEDLHMKMPLLHNSLAVEFDPMNTPDTTLNVLHGGVGVITEAGEIADLLIRAIEDGDRDDVNVMEECGDLRWYIARMLRGINKTDRDCERANINKLRGRHGVTFDAERDSNRDLVLERTKLEKDFGTPLLETNTFNEDVEEPSKIDESTLAESLAGGNPALAAELDALKQKHRDEQKDKAKLEIAEKLSAMEDHDADGMPKLKVPHSGDMSDVADAELAANVGIAPQGVGGVKPLPPGGPRG